MNYKANKKKKYTFFKNKSTDIILTDNKVSSSFFNISQSINIDQIYRKKRISAFTTKTDKKSIKEKEKEMKLLSKYINKPFFTEFPKVKRQNNKFKTNLEEYNTKEIIKELKYYSKDFIKDKITKKFICNLNILEKDSKLYSNEFNFFNLQNRAKISLVANIKDKTQSNHYVNEITTKPIDYEKIFTKLKNTINSEKNAVATKTHYNDIILSPKVFSDLVSAFILDKINIENIKLKQNYIAKDFGKQIFDSSLNISENPFLDFSYFSKSYDYDFIRTTKKEIIKNGKINSYFVNLNDSFKYKKEPSGNTLSGNRVTNIEIEKGQKSLDKMISETDNGIIARKIIGLHTTNSTEGHLNVTIDMGNEIKKGEIVRNVKNYPLTIFITDLFSNIELSKDTEQVFNFNAPYLKKQGE